MARHSNSRRNSPPQAEVIWGSGVVVGRPPRNISVRARPPGDASPPPCPACNSTAMARMNESSSRTAIRIVETMRQVSYSARGGLHKLRPALRIEGCAADEHAVELPLGEELCDVLQAHAPPIHP